ncbi:YbjQ family protein [Indioceanicola profundi]|uniref:YbjQ family protein n=1 Tax=Indioceanicola profundi TaxID=2220096 RepID=UPI000E6AB826|nr:YbjQ family protein [Indioceanicola profundi]
MHISTLDHLPGFRIVRSHGLVQGSTVRSKHLGRDFMAGLKTLVGGELRGYTELMEEARAEALARMIAAARELGADAVVGLRFGTAGITDGASEILAYGTAVGVEPDMSTPAG